MTDVGEILEAVVDELHRAFGYFLCAVVRAASDGHVESARRCAATRSSPSATAVVASRARRA